jgi:hypothetical protein
VLTGLSERATASSNTPVEDARSWRFSHDQKLPLTLKKQLHVIGKWREYSCGDERKALAHTAIIQDGQVRV